MVYEKIKNKGYDELDSIFKNINSNENNKKNKNNNKKVNYYKNKK